MAQQLTVIRSPYRPGMGLEPPYLGDRQPQLVRFRGILGEPDVPHYDEFHVVQERPGQLTLSALLAATAAVQQRGVPLVLVLCGLPSVVEHLARSKSYSERMFTTEVLGNLRPPEDCAALEGPAARHGRRFAEDAVEAVVGDTAGYPFFNNQPQPVLRSMVRKGLIYRPERGRIAFTAPMFGAYIGRRGD